jgi:hypothetical protein
MLPPAFKWGSFVPTLLPDITAPPLHSLLWLCEVLLVKV